MFLRTYKNEDDKMEGSRQTFMGTVFAYQLENLHLYHISLTKAFNMIKLRLIIVLIAIFSNQTFSQSPSSKQDKKAEEILKGVSNKYKSFKSVKATFVITMENPKDNTKDLQKGTICLKGNKYNLEVAGQNIVSDGKTRWTYVKDANEVQIDNLKSDENSITPANIFTMYEKGFLFKFIGEQNEKGMIYQLVELVPVDPKKKNFFKVKLSVNKSDKFITSAKLFDKNGTIQTISVDKLTPDACDDEAIYSFSASKYPGAEVIDLR
ncbi:LolA-like putative outer membrane lipoprotein chaperone [soil metagenome]